MKKYIIFDFDGTLVNTNDIIVASWEATYHHYLGHIPDRRKIEASFGEVLRDTILREIPDADVDEVIAYYRNYQDTHASDGLVYVFDGIRELLTELRARGYLTGVATSRTAYSLRNYMNDLGITDLVDAIVSVDDVKHHKPHPETADKVLEKLGGTAEEAIMVGDTRYDIGCAKNAGADSVLVGWSHYVDMEDLEEKGLMPTYMIDSPLDLLELI